MNLYLVVSEKLVDIVWEDWTVNAGHYEPYAIAELVVARNNSQARYLAWKTDSDFCYDMSEMPRFRTELKLRDVDGPARVVTDEDGYKGDRLGLWAFKDEVDDEPIPGEIT